MPVSEQERKDFVKAKMALQAAKKTKDSLPPVIKKAYDPENCLLSKAEFIAKQRKLKEEEVAAKEFIAKRKGSINGVREEEVKEEKVAEPKKTGRPKRVE